MGTIFILAILYGIYLGLRDIHNVKVGKTKGISMKNGLWDYFFCNGDDS